MLHDFTPEPLISPEILRLNAGLDEFKGPWRAFKRLNVGIE